MTEALDRSLDVLLVVPNLSGGGAEGAMLRYATALGKHGHRARLVLLEDKGSYAIPAGIDVHILGRSVLGSGTLGVLHMGRHLARWALRAGGGKPFDVVISTLTLADRVVAASGLANVHMRISNSLSESLTRLGDRKPGVARRRRAMLRDLYEGRNLIAVSDGMAEELRAFLGGRCRVEVVPNPFDFDALRRRAAEHEPDLPREPFLLHVGRANPQKRHDVLLDAYVASGIPHALVLLSPDADRLAGLVAGRGLAGRVKVAGFRSNPFPWYKAAEAVVLSSDYEGMPNVLIEAIACGTPVVSTDCPSGPSELLVGDLRPFLVPRGDVQALADALRRVVSSPPRVDPALVSRFSEAAVVSAVERLAASRVPLRGLS